PGYCHLYLVDQSSYVFDLSSIDPATTGVDPDAAKTVDSWRTVVVGGMRFGGACKNEGDACTQDMDGDGDIDSDDCVNTPVADLGYSSYFALDITNTAEAPKLLWEFNDPDLGYSTTGPAIVRIAATSVDGGGTEYFDNTKNGYWYIVVGSGPTGPIDKDNTQFLGRSDQNFKLFVFDAYEGPNSGLTVIDTGVPDAFAGSMFNIAFDTLASHPDPVVKDYSDDAMYIGYTKKCTSDRAKSGVQGECNAGYWNDGGIGRLVTFADPDPAKWEYSTLIDGIGPVTAATAKAIAADAGADDIILVLAATGRYSYVRPLANGTSMPDDYQAVRHIIGTIDPCYYSPKFPYGDAPANGGAGCSGVSVDLNEFNDVTDVADVIDGLKDAGKAGWFIEMDPSGTYTEENMSGVEETFEVAAERAITDLVATSDGVLF
ncbi:hypothetical protein LCGC14_2718770, partial [marine sediment metagenome]